MSGIKNKQLDHDPHTVAINNGQATVSTRDGVDHRASQSSDTAYKIQSEDGEKFVLVVTMEQESQASFEGATIVSGEVNSEQGSTSVIVFFNIAGQTKGWILSGD